ncbi:MAG: DNA methylase, partial [Sphaerochaetaceae bacterium]|nr:DNA methylase [Sphaerochaetaceae bacterium]
MSERSLFEKTYIAIDLKSFYASVECVQRGLDPLTTNLVVADTSRTEKTICLAVSPSLKAYGVSGRPRLFEVIQKVKEINNERLFQIRRQGFRDFIGESYMDLELKANPSLALSFLAAPPQMAKYIEISTKIYNIYLKYVSKDDIHVYSIDEVFIDATDYLRLYNLTAYDFTMKLVRDVLRNTGITATAGIGTNLYLAKVAMDIVAKHIPPDKDGVRIAQLDELSYRRNLWIHRPLTDFWRIGHGLATRLEALGLYTMGDIARFSLTSEDIIYSVFGINGELIIDHAWGWEPCTMKDIKAYKPVSSSLSSGQVLQSPYNFQKAQLVVKEMADLLSLDMVEKGLVGNQVILYIGYDNGNLLDDKKSLAYKGDVVFDYYGRPAPKGAHGNVRLKGYTCSAKAIGEAALEIFNKNVDPKLFVRRINITVNN